MDIPLRGKRVSSAWTRPRPRWTTCERLVRPGSRSRYALAEAVITKVESGENPRVVMAQVGHADRA